MGSKFRTNTAARQNGERASRRLGGLSPLHNSPKAASAPTVNGRRANSRATKVKTKASVTSSEDDDLITTPPTATVADDSTSQQQLTFSDLVSATVQSASRNTSEEPEGTSSRPTSSGSNRKLAVSKTRSAVTVVKTAAANRPRRGAPSAELPTIQETASAVQPIHQETSSVVTPHISSPAQPPPKTTLPGSFPAETVHRHSEYDDSGEDAVDWGNGTTFMEEDQQSLPASYTSKPTSGAPVLPSVQEVQENDIPGRFFFTNSGDKVDIFDTAEEPTPNPRRLSIKRSYQSFVQPTAESNVEQPVVVESSPPKRQRTNNHITPRSEHSFLSILGVSQPQTPSPSRVRNFIPNMGLEQPQTSQSAHDLVSNMELEQPQTSPSSQREQSIISNVRLEQPHPVSPSRFPIQFGMVSNARTQLPQTPVRATVDSDSVAFTPSFYSARSFQSGRANAYQTPLGFDVDDDSLGTPDGVSTPAPNSVLAKFKSLVPRSAGSIGQSQNSPTPPTFDTPAAAAAEVKPSVPFTAPQQRRLPMNNRMQFSRNFGLSKEFGYRGRKDKYAGLGGPNGRRIAYEHEEIIISDDEDDNVKPKKSFRYIGSEYQQDVLMRRGRAELIKELSSGSVEDVPGSGPSMLVSTNACVLPATASNERITLTDPKIIDLLHNLASFVKSNPIIQLPDAAQLTSFLDQINSNESITEEPAKPTAETVTMSASGTPSNITKPNIASPTVVVTDDTTTAGSSVLDGLVSDSPESTAKENSEIVMSGGLNDKKEDEDEDMSEVISNASSPFVSTPVVSTTPAAPAPAAAGSGWFSAAKSFISSASPLKVFSRSRDAPVVANDTATQVIADINLDPPAAENKKVNRYDNSQTPTRRPRPTRSKPIPAPRSVVKKKSSFILRLPSPDKDDVHGSSRRDARADEANSLRTSNVVNEHGKRSGSTSAAPENTSFSETRDGDLCSIPIMELVASLDENESVVEVTHQWYVKDGQVKNAAYYKQAIDLRKSQKASTQADKVVSTPKTENRKMFKKTQTENIFKKNESENIFKTTETENIFQKTDNIFKGLLSPIDEQPEIKAGIFPPGIYRHPINPNLPTRIEPSIAFPGYWFINGELVEMEPTRPSSKAGSSSSKAQTSNEDLNMAKQQVSPGRTFSVPEDSDSDDDSPSTDKVGRGVTPSQSSRGDNRDPAAILRTTITNRDPAAILETSSSEREVADSTQPNSRQEKSNKARSSNPLQEKQWPQSAPPPKPRPGNATLPPPYDKYQPKQPSILRKCTTMSPEQIREANARKKDGTFVIADGAPSPPLEVKDDNKENIENVEGDTSMHDVSMEDVFTPPRSPTLEELLDIPEPRVNFGAEVEKAVNEAWIKYPPPPELLRGVLL